MKKIGIIILVKCCMAVQAFSAVEGIELDIFLNQSFPDVDRSNIIIKELKGGLSGSSLSKVEVNNKTYVLRISMNSQDTVELNTFIEASKIGLTPRIIAVSPNKDAIIMEYIDQKTLTLEEAKIPENIVRMAHSLKQAHQLAGGEPGESLLSKAQRCYPIVYNQSWAPKPEVTKALEIIEKSTEELSKYDYTKVRVHGDLNPRNIFVTADRVLFIDWAETHLDDPLYDVSFLALKLDYTPAEEAIFIKAYQGRALNTEESNRYSIHKKVLQAFWSLTNLYLANAELKKNPKDTINTSASLKSWNYYQKSFADNVEPHPAQYFYELSRMNYQKALL